MDWTLMIIGILTALWAGLAGHLIWREKKRSCTSPFRRWLMEFLNHGTQLWGEIVNVTQPHIVHEKRQAENRLVSFNGGRTMGSVGARETNPRASGFWTGNEQNFFAKGKTIWESVVQTWKEVAKKDGMFGFSTRRIKVKPDFCFTYTSSQSKPD